MLLFTKQGGLWLGMTGGLSTQVKMNVKPIGAFKSGLIRQVAFERRGLKIQGPLYFTAAALLLQNLVGNSEEMLNKQRQVSMFLIFLFKLLTQFPFVSILSISILSLLPFSILSLLPLYHPFFLF